MKTPRSTLADQFIGYVAGLRFPWLLGITLGLFLFDLVVPDIVPFVDEILLGLLAALLATLKKRRKSEVLESHVRTDEPRL